MAFVPKWLFLAVLLFAPGAVLAHVTPKQNIDFARATEAPVLAVIAPVEVEKPILLAKRGGKGISLKKLRSLRAPTKGELLDGFKRLRSGLTIANLVAVGPMFGLLIFGFAGFVRFIRSLIRGVFVRSYRALVVDVRMTDRGRYRPIVAFEHRSGQVYRVLAPFEMRRDPEGREMGVEVSGSRVTVVQHRRGFFGALLGWLLPMLLAFTCMMILADRAAQTALG